MICNGCPVCVSTVENWGSHVAGESRYLRKLKTNPQTQYNYTELELYANTHFCLPLWSCHFSKADLSLVRGGELAFRKLALECQTVLGLGSSG